ncbi:unnamed protein product [Zymoseptoria tritici ST99CH_1A5]|uniref:gamma-glutamylcyclotransferase n=1 Tax=Zymoseptoria tritici ST99CH_1A5 TaxID=1276529 RepID=A0A1Y6LQZ9_ZYMTR|nr:unnamed protein product [Zymoseptoria tritici ST99CH_1A5]
MATGYSTEESMAERALSATAYSVEHAIRDHAGHDRPHLEPHAPPPDTPRLAATQNDSAFDLDDFAKQASTKKGTVLYLAYGSNLSIEKFRGARGIKPLSQINVQVPSLRLTFDLPGIAYNEPCFANSARRDSKNDHPRNDATSEKMRLLGERSRTRGYRKEAWHKGLIGVVYEVTPEDYAHIIATEGGGASYHDIVVDCHPFASSDVHHPVPQVPATPSFKAHTLFAPAIPPGEEPPTDGGRLTRPRPGYAQASARYLKLITDGAAELGLPMEYQRYLLAIRPYRVTTVKQRVGQASFAALWMPLVFLLFGLSNMFSDKNGKVPAWITGLLAFIFKAAWRSYDVVFLPVFGDGERTIGDEEEEEGNPISDRASDASGCEACETLEKTAG